MARIVFPLSLPSPMVRSSLFGFAFTSILNVHLGPAFSPYLDTLALPAKVVVWKQAQSFGKRSPRVIKDTARHVPSSSVGLCFSTTSFEWLAPSRRHAARGSKHC